MASKAISIFLTVICSASVYAGSFSAYVDKTEGTLADQFILTLQVEGKADSKPQLPDLDNFTVSSSGTSHSTSWINGEISSKVSYRYTLTPRRIGKLQIPSLSLVVDGKRIDTLPITINVQKELNSPRSSSPAVFLERTFSNDEVYVGQQVIETIKIHYRVDMRDAQQEARQMTDFIEFDLGKERRYRKTVNGITYQVIEIKNSLIPLKAHDTHVPRYVLQALIPSTSRHRNPFDDMWGDFFSSTHSVRKRLISKEFNLRVLPLPPPPADSIDLAIVGEFNLKARIDKRQLNIGESATLTLEISGVGNLQGMQPIDFELTAAKVYSDKPQIKLQKNWDTGLNSSAVFTFSILPNQEGDLNLGQHKFSFFNPKTGKHETVTLAFGTLQVDASKQEEQRVVVGNKKPSVSTLMDIHRGAALTVNHSLTPELRYRLWAIASLLLLIYASLYLYQRFGKRKRPRINAYREFKHACIDDIASLDKSIRSYLCNKYDVQMSATRQEINSSLRAHGLQIKLQERVDRFLRQLEFALFASQHAQNLTEIIAEGKAIVATLERSEQ